MAIYTAARPTFENEYIHGIRVQSLHGYILGLKMNIYTAAVFNVTWLYTRFENEYIHGSHIQRNIWLYTRFENEYIHGSRIQSSMAIYTANVSTYENG